MIVFQLLTGVHNGTAVGTVPTQLSVKKIQQGILVQLSGAKTSDQLSQHSSMNKLVHVDARSSSIFLIAAVSVVMKVRNHLVDVYRCRSTKCLFLREYACSRPVLCSMLFENGRHDLASGSVWDSFVAGGSETDGAGLYGRRARDYNSLWRTSSRDEKPSSYFSQTGSGGCGCRYEWVQA